VDHDRSGVASAAWFRRQHSGESGGRGCAERRDGAGQRGQDGGETGDEAGVMDTVPRDSRCRADRSCSRIRRLPPACRTRRSGPIP
jgi:hypothetical protein